MVRSRIMRPTRELVGDVGVALVGVVIASGLRVLMTPLWGQTLPLLTYVPAIGAVAWLAGRRAGVIATGLSAVSAALLWTWTDTTLTTLGHLSGIAVFVAVGVFLSVVIQARRDVEERFRQLTENIDACFWITDAATRHVRYVSPACERLWGFTVKDFYEDPLHWLDAVHEDDRARAEAAFVDRVARESFDEMYRMTTPARGVRWIRDRGFPVRDRTGRVRTIVGVAEDVTERVEAERSLAVLLADATAANQAKDEFLATLGHELRNPLGAISSAAHVLALATTGSEMARRAGAVVSHQVEHLARLVDDLLDVSRVMTGKIALRATSLDLAVVARQALDGLAASGQSAERRLHVDLSPAWVRGDEARLEQVVTNLVSNALKYTPANGQVHVQVGVEGDRALLRVSDTGIGLGADLLPRVFDLFVQGDGGVHRPHGGLGIGLALVRRLVELHHGAVMAESAGPGEGSTFTVRLPAIAPPAPAPSAPGARESKPVRPLRILVVEDNEDAREMLQVLLRLNGHETDGAASGTDGVARALETRPDVAIVDLGLPGLDGYEVAARIRAGAGSAVRLIALTGYGQDEDRHRTRAAGFDAHLVKPVEMQRLSQVLGELAARADSAARPTGS